MYMCLRMINKLLFAIGIAHRISLPPPLIDLNHFFRSPSLNPSELIKNTRDVEYIIYAFLKFRFHGMCNGSIYIVKRSL